MARRIRKGDLVQVVSGAHRGKRGEILRVLVGAERVVVRGILVKRHNKPVPGRSAGGILEKEASLPISNVMLIDPGDDRPTRIRSEVREGRAVRVGVRTGTVIR